MSARTPMLSHLAGSFALLALAALVAAGPALAEPISDRFDGQYAGTIHVVAALSQQGCRDRAPHEVTIKKGIMHGRSAALGTRISGFVTSDGFFTGSYRFSDGAKTGFEGSIEDGTLVGGVFSTDQHCAWLVKLTKRG